MIINRVWAMPNRWTFKIKPIQELLKRYHVGLGWIDPFCGECSPAEFKNDLNPNNKHAEYHLEAIDFLNLLDWRVSGALFDPPYSLTQVARSYSQIGLKFKSKENPTGGFPKVRRKLAEILPDNSYCISCGWNTCGLGKKNNFKIVEILIICHGGNHNDTLVVVEQKIKAKPKMFNQYLRGLVECACIKR